MSNSRRTIGAAQEIHRAGGTHDARAVRGGGSLLCERGGL